MDNHQTIIDFTNAVREASNKTLEMKNLPPELEELKIELKAMQNKCIQYLHENFKAKIGEKN